MDYLLVPILLAAEEASEVPIIGGREIDILFYEGYLLVGGAKILVNANVAEDDILPRIKQIVNEVAVLTGYSQVSSNHWKVWAFFPGNYTIYEHD